MKLYVGSRDYCPEGFKTVDIDPTYQPDIVADITDMKGVEDECADEVVANAVLEHIAWPNSFKALCECTRVLKWGGILRVSVPDLGLLCEEIAKGKAAWYPVALLYGVGQLENAFEQHRFGWTKEMMLQLLIFLGYDSFRHFNSDISDSSNAWMYRDAGEKVACSLNIECEKTNVSLGNASELYQKLMENPMLDVTACVGKLMGEGNLNTKILQANTEYAKSLEFEIINAKQRILYLEEEIRKAKVPCQSVRHIWGKRK